MVTVPPEAKDAARDAARPFAADIAEAVTAEWARGTTAKRLAEIIGAGVASAALRTLEAAAPHLAAAHNHGSLCPGHREPDCPVCEQIDEAAAAARTAQREADARLAHDRRATWAAPCKGSEPHHLLCHGVHHLPFADLLRNPPEGAPDDRP